MMAAVLLEAVSLKSLDISNTKLNPIKFTKISNALKSISSLKAFDIDICNRAVDSIIDAKFSNSLIEKINLSHNGLSYTGVLNIASTLSKSITVFDVSSNVIISDDVTDLANALSDCVLLQKFNISQNLLTFTNILTIAQCFRNHHALQTLDLSNNKLLSFSSACEFIVDMILSVNEMLVNLNVCGRNIRPRYVEDYLSPPNE